MNQAPNPSFFLIQVALIVLIFYFLLFRPQKKAQEEHKKKIEQLKKNDEVTTSGGVYGTVVNVKEKTVVLRIDQNVKIEVLKNCISTIRRKAGE